MLRTEDEASGVRCQESFNAPPIKSNGAAAYVAMFCLGTDCMSWRWGEDENEVVLRSITAGKPDGDGWEKSSRDNDYPGMKSWWRPRGDRRRGYCGKAGKPS